MDHTQPSDSITSFVSRIIMDLSEIYEQTHEMKIAINHSITNTGHGSIILGSSSRLDKTPNIRMLVGAHFARHGTLKIGTFGGGCSRNEITINTMIRETIEEIFNFHVSEEVIDNIRDFLNTNTHLYYIFQVSRTTLAYSYIFDASILGEFIRIILEYYEARMIARFIPANDSLININLYLHKNIQFLDDSSFDGKYREYSPYSTIKLVDFIKERVVSYKQRQTRSHGLNEIKYLSMVSLSKLVSNAPTGFYELFNFNKKHRENLEMQRLLKSILEKDIMKIILSYQ